jgi:hypothetical protein
MEQMNTNKNNDMRIEQLQMELGKMGPPVLRRNAAASEISAATAQLITADGIGRTQRRIDAAKTIKAFLRRKRQTSARRVFLSHMESRNRHLESLKSLERQISDIKKRLEMEKQVMRTTLSIFNKYPKPGE